jgi:hypothetical protein
MSNNQKIADAVNEIWEILRALPGPQDAAKALAGAHVMLMEEDDAQTEADLRAKLRDVDAAVLESWAKRRGASLAS